MSGQKKIKMDNGSFAKRVDQEFFMDACSKGFTSVLKYFIDSVDINQANWRGWTPLMAAAASG